jgi:hypothetical protein
MLRRLWLWLRIEKPPKQYFRCGTPLLWGPPEAARLLEQRWREEDEKYAAWVEAHPRPKEEWLDQARRIRRMAVGRSREVPHNP